MQSEWRLEHDWEPNVWVLSDGTRKAWFDIASWLDDNPTAFHFAVMIKHRPFDSLAAMLRMGLRPYCVEGDFSNIGTIADTKVLFHAN